VPSCSAREGTAEDELLRIRLRRTGKKKQPHYRVVVADQRAPRDGDFVEVLGHYNPRTEPTTLVLDEDRVKHWLSVGAQPSETVHRMLHKAGLTEVEPPRRVTKQSRAERDAAGAAARAEEEAATAAAEAAAAAAKDTAEDAEAATDGDNSGEESES
jgi:small subunit ribosomal protein S16